MNYGKQVKRNSASPESGAQITIEISRNKERKVGLKD